MARRSAIVSQAAEILQHRHLDEGGVENASVTSNVTTPPVPAEVCALVTEIVDLGTTLQAALRHPVSAPMLQMLGDSLQELQDEVNRSERMLTMMRMDVGKRFWLLFFSNFICFL